MLHMTKELRQLVQELNDLGVQREVVGDRLRLWPRRVLTPEVVERVKRHKPALIQLIVNGAHGDSGDGDKTSMKNPESTIPSPSPVSPAGENGDKTPDVARIIERILSEPVPPFPSPAQWITGRNISMESVGFDRFQYGGRPHCLRPDLRQQWLEAYTTAMQVMSEPEAWQAAWRAIRELT